MKSRISDRVWDNAHCFQAEAPSAPARTVRSFARGRAQAICCAANSSVPAYIASRAADIFGETDSDIRGRGVLLSQASQSFLVFSISVEVLKGLRAFLRPINRARPL
jgi:hypothetical protein